MENLTLFGRLISDATRLRIIKLLLTQPMCVCELMETLSLNQPCVSQQLALLKNHHLLKGHRESQWIVYEINRKVWMRYLKDIMYFSKAPLTSLPSFKKETHRLASLKHRGLLSQKLKTRQYRISG